MAIFLQFLALKRCWNTYLYSVFWTSTKNCPKNGPPQKKTITFDILQSTGSLKKRFVATPLLTKNFCFFKVVCFETKNIDVEQKHNLNQEIAKIRKRDLKEKTTQETQKRENKWMKKKCNWIFSCCSFYETKSRGVNREKLTVKKIINNEMFFFTVYVPYKPWKALRKPWKIGSKNPPFFHRSFFTVYVFLTKAKKKEKERKRQKQEPKESKNKDKKEEKRTRTRERQRKRNRKRGRPKKAKEKQRETLKNKQKMPFSRGKTRFCVLKSKERKEESKKKQTKTNK